MVRIIKFDSKNHAKQIGFMKLRSTKKNLLQLVQ